MTMFVIVGGNPVDGFAIYGPFASHEEAIHWAERWLDGDWWSAELRIVGGNPVDGFPMTMFVTPVNRSGRETLANKIMREFG